MNAFKFVVIFISIALSSCSEVASDKLRSAGFYADITLTANNQYQTDVTAVLKTSPAIDADYINLSHNDVLTVNAQGQTQVLRYKKGLFGDVKYQSKLNINSNKTQFVVSLDRNQDKDMPTSVVTMPKSFNMVLPYPFQSLGLFDTIVTVWDGDYYNDKVDINYQATCWDNVYKKERTFYKSYWVADSGIHTLDVLDLIYTSSSYDFLDKSQACVASVSITRSNTGMLDKNYGSGGQITAKQVRRVLFSIYP